MELKIIDEKFMITDVNENLTRDNRPFMRFSLSDNKSKQYNAIMFNVKDLQFTPAKGDVIKLTGIVQNYNGQVQIKISEMEKLEGESNLEFIPKSVHDVDVMFGDLKHIILDNLSNKYLIKLVEYFFNDNQTIDKFKKSPAARSIHHAHIGGLLEHTLSVIKVCLMLSSHYKEYINKELLLIGALFHDIGKIYELDFKGGINYTNDGKLLGHLMLGVTLIEHYISKIDDFPDELKTLLLHMIVSHHGYLEFGSPKRPKIYEAMLLYFVDDLDAKMNSIESIFTKEGIFEGWSSFDKALDRQLFKHNIMDLDE